MPSDANFWRARHVHKHAFAGGMSQRRRTFCTASVRHRIYAELAKHLCYLQAQTSRSAGEERQPPSQALQRGQMHHCFPIDSRARCRCGGSAALFNRGLAG
jgi:hypothetical protein